MKKIKKTLTLVIALSIACAFVLSGCSAKNWNGAYNFVLNQYADTDGAAIDEPVIKIEGYEFDLQYATVKDFKDAGFTFYTTDDPATEYSSDYTVRGHETVLSYMYWGDEQYLVDLTNYSSGDCLFDDTNIFLIFTGGSDYDTGYSMTFPGGFRIGGSASDIESDYGDYLLTKVTGTLYGENVSEYLLASFCGQAAICVDIVACDMYDDGGEYIIDCEYILNDNDINSVQNIALKAKSYQNDAAAVVGGRYMDLAAFPYDLFPKDSTSDEETDGSTNNKIPTDYISDDCLNVIKEQVNPLWISYYNGEISVEEYADAIQPILNDAGFYDICRGWFEDYYDFETIGQEAGTNQLKADVGEDDFQLFYNFMQ